MSREREGERRREKERERERERVIEEEEEEEERRTTDGTNLCTFAWDPLRQRRWNGSIQQPLPVSPCHGYKAVLDIMCGNTKTHTHTHTHTHMPTHTHAHARKYTHAHAQARTGTHLQAKGATSTPRALKIGVGGVIGAEIRTKMTNGEGGM